MKSRKLLALRSQQWHAEAPDFAGPVTLTNGIKSCSNLSLPRSPAQVQGNKEMGGSKWRDENEVLVERGRAKIKFTPGTK
eukprot:1158619-Pelagomonas_calceolata.AAC.1